MVKVGRRRIHTRVGGQTGAWLKGIATSSLLIWAVAWAVVMPTGTAASTAAAAVPLAVHVSGTQLLDGSGSPLQLHGVNRSGPEYACAQGWGIFDGPSDAASVAAIASWHVNAVRIPVDEDCWLGINGIKPAYAGSNYRNAIVNYVNLLNSYGIYAIIDLATVAPGTTVAGLSLEPPIGFLVVRG